MGAPSIHLRPWRRLRRSFANQQPLSVAAGVRISPRIVDVLCRTDRPSIGRPATASRSNARSACSTSSSSVGPSTVDLQGTSLGLDIGLGEQTRFARGHAHRTRQISRVHDSPHGHGSHRHRGGASDHPRHEADASRAGLRHTTYGRDTIEFDAPPSIFFVCVECRNPTLAKCGG